MSAQRQTPARTVTPRLRQPAPPPAPAPAPSQGVSRFDLNGDGKVDQADVLLLMALLNATAPPTKAEVVIRQQADFNNDGVLNNIDLSLLLAQVGQEGGTGGSGGSAPPSPVQSVPGQAPPAAPEPAPSGKGSSGTGSGPEGAAPVVNPTPPAPVQSAPDAPAPTDAPPQGSQTRRGLIPPQFIAPVVGGPAAAPGAAAAAPQFVTGPFLVNGGGFNGATAEPQPLGGGPYATAKAIARWDVVPFQSFSADFNVGVVAFHAAGIDRVEFSANNGTWVAVRDVRQNAQTGVWEYYATLRPGDFPDGVVEIRAIAYPRTGIPRVLDGIRLYANSRGTLAQNSRYVSPTGDDTGGDGSQARPFKTLHRAMLSLTDAGGANGADNGVVLCMPGTYEYSRPQVVQTPRTTNVWATIQPAPGVNRDQVRIVTAAGGAANANGGMWTKLVRLRNVTLTAVLDTSTQMEDYLWLDTVKRIGGGERDTNVYFTNAWWTAMYATDSEANDVVQAFMSMALVRNCKVDRLYDDAFPGSLAVINVTVKNANGGVSPNGYAYHSDVWQDRNPYTTENLVLYGLTATENCTQQGIFSRGLFQKDVAIVNCSFDLNGYPNQSQWRTRTDHLVVMNNTLLGAPFCLGLSDTDTQGTSGFLGSTNTVFRNNVFQWVNLDDPLRRSGPNQPTYEQVRSSATFSNNHFINRWPASAGASAGQAIWCAVPMGDGASTGLSIRTGIGAYGAGAPPWASAN